LLEASDFASQTGLGVSGTVERHAAVVGNGAQMQRTGVDPTPLSDLADIHRTQGAGVVLVALDRRLAGLLAVTDRSGCPPEAMLFGNDSADSCGRYNAAGPRYRIRQQR
jgi:hypothetical protein